MKRKTLIFALALCLVTACAFSITACKSHSHTFSTEYVSDATHHWRVCTGENCGEISDKEEHIFDKEVVDAKYLKSVANCSERAIYFKSCVCGAKGETTFQVGDIDENTHVYGETTYTWSNDKSSCIAERVCSRDASHKDTATGVVTNAVTQTQSCENDELTTYTATFSKEGYVTQTEVVKTKEKLGHEFGEPKYIWSQDGLTCVAERVCSRDASHKETVNAIMSSQPTQAQTCEDDEISTMTATFTNTVFATQTKENVKTKEKLGHDYGDPTYIWSGDYSSCVAERICSHDASHKDTATGVVTSVVTQTQSCENDELTTYTATFSIVPYENQSKIVKTKDKLGHDMQQGEEWTHNEVSHWRECKNDCGTKTDLGSHEFNYDDQTSYDENGYKVFPCSCGATTKNLNETQIKAFLNIDTSYVNYSGDYTIKYYKNANRVMTFAYKPSAGLYYIDDYDRRNMSYMQAVQSGESTEYYIYFDSQYGYIDLKKSIRKQQYDDYIEAYANISKSIDVTEDLANKQEVEYYLGKDAYYYNVFGKTQLVEGVKRTTIEIEFPRVVNNGGGIVTQERKELVIEDGKIIYYSDYATDCVDNQIEVLFNSTNVTLTQTAINSITSTRNAYYLFNVSTYVSEIYEYLGDNNLIGTNNIFPNPSPSRIVVDNETQFITMTLELPVEVFDKYDITVTTSFKNVINHTINGNVGAENTFVINMPFIVDSNSEAIFKVFIDATPKTTNLTLKVSDNAEDDIQLYAEFGEETEIPLYMAFGENPAIADVFDVRGKVFKGFTFDNPSQVAFEDIAFINDQTLIAKNSVIYAVYTDAQVITLNIPSLDVSDRIVLDDDGLDFYTIVEENGERYVELPYYETSAYGVVDSEYYGIMWYKDSDFTTLVDCKFMEMYSQLTKIGTENQTFYGRLEKYGTIQFCFEGEIPEYESYYTDYFKQLYLNDFNAGYNAMLQLANDIFEVSYSRNLLITDLYVDVEMTQKWSSCGNENITLFAKATKLPSIIESTTNTEIGSVKELVTKANQYVESGLATSVTEAFESLVIERLRDYAYGFEVNDIQAYVDSGYTTLISEMQELPSIHEEFVIYVIFNNEVKGVYYDNSQLYSDTLFERYGDIKINALHNLYDSSEINERSEELIANLKFSDCFPYFASFYEYCQPEYEVVDIFLDKEMTQSIKNIDAWPTDNVTIFPKSVKTHVVIEGYLNRAVLSVKNLKKITADKDASEVYEFMVSYFADPLYYDMPIDGLYIDKDFETVWDGVLPEVVAEDLVLFVKVSNAIYFDDSVYTPIVKYVSLEIVNNFYDLQSRINKAYNLPNDTIIIDVFTDKGQTTLLQDIPLETVKIYPKFTSSWIIDGVSGNIMMPLQAFKDYVYDETGKDVDEFDIEEIKGYFLDFIGSPSEEKEYYLNSLYVDKDFLIPWTQMPEDGENLVVCIKEEGPIIKFSDKHGVPLQEFIFVKYVPFDDEYFTNWVNSMYLLPYGCFTIELYLDEERTVRFTQMPTEDVTVYAKIIRV